MSLEYGPIRSIEGDTILSPSLPRLGVRISPNFIYLGDLQYIARETHHVEEFIFLNPNGLGHVTHMLLVRFEGFLENKAGKYDYPARPTVRLDGNDYLYDLFFIDLPDFIDQQPNSDIAHAADYIRQRAYTLAGEMTYQRFLRVVSGDRRSQFIVAYLERNEEPLLTADTLAQDANSAQALRERALASFTVLH